MTHDDEIDRWARARRTRPVPADARKRIEEAAAAATHAAHAPDAGRRGAAIALLVVGTVRLVWLLFSGVEWS